MRFWDKKNIHNFLVKSNPSTDKKNRIIAVFTNNLSKLYNYLAFERSSNSTSNSFKLLATLLLLTAVVAITEDKSRCGTGGATLSFLKELLSR